MAILFDLAILAILVFSIWRGASRGLVRALCGLVAVAFAFFGAGFLARTLSPMVADALEPKFSAAIEARLNEEIQKANMPSAIDPKTGEVNPQLPADLPVLDVINLLKSMGLYEEFTDVVDGAVKNGLTSVAAAAAASVAARIAQSVAYSLIFFFSFTVASAIWGVVSHALNLMVKLPGLHFLNQVGGAIFGFAAAVVFLFALGIVSRLLGGLIPAEIVGQSHLLKLFLGALPAAGASLPL